MFTHSRLRKPFKREIDLLRATARRDMRKAPTHPIGLDLQALYYVFAPQGGRNWVQHSRTGNDPVAINLLPAYHPVHLLRALDRDGFRKVAYFRASDSPLEYFDTSGEFLAFPRPHLRPVSYLSRLQSTLRLRSGLSTAVYFKAPYDSVVVCVRRFQRYATSTTQGEQSRYGAERNSFVKARK